MKSHADYIYSITLRSDDIALVNCLRALSQYSQKLGNVRIPWGGTKESDWRKDGHEVTFHFSHPEYRDIFLVEVKRLLPNNLWHEVKKSDNDPAKPAT